MPQSMAVMAFVSEPMWKRSVSWTLSGLARVRTPATPVATVSPLRTTAAAMPGRSCFSRMGVRRGETSFVVGVEARRVNGVRHSSPRARRRMDFIRLAPGWGVMCPDKASFVPMVDRCQMPVRTRFSCRRVKSLTLRPRIGCTRGVQEMSVEELVGLVAGVGGEVVGRVGVDGFQVVGDVIEFVDGIGGGEGVFDAGDFEIGVVEGGVDEDGARGDRREELGE